MSQLVSSFAFKFNLRWVRPYTKVKDGAAPPVFRRRLLAGSVTVDFEVEAASMEAAKAAGDLVKKTDLKVGRCNLELVLKAPVLQAHGFSA